MVHACILSGTKRRKKKGSFCEQGPGNRWFYVKLINHAGGHVRVSPDQILPATTLNVDESQVEYARLEPGDEYKRIVLRAVDVKNDEPLKLNGEFTLALRPDDAGDVARVKITRGDTIYAKCDNFATMEGDSKFEYQISTDDTKSWFDSVRACKLCDSELLSVHTHEENDFITKQLRKSSEVNKLWIGMSYKEKVRMWSWIDGSRYRYQNWKEGQHYDGKDEQCGIMYQRYDWEGGMDDNCYKPLGYICKRHRTRSDDKSKDKKDSSKDKSGCPDILPECPSLCSIVKVPGSCPQCDCGPLVKGYDTMNKKEQAEARRTFSQANHQMLAAKRARIDEAQAMRRSRIMQEAGRLMAESRNLQRVAMLEGIPIRLALQPQNRRQMILKPDKSETEISKTRDLAGEIASLISDIEKAGKEKKSS
ncbi:C-type lectin domain 19 member A [Desmophyllum pertusum]|uniref:C-type lectin domain 19 member A n=1 Tax=Desmophyllum pertusum TaxID=174260 RepID=A0A9X0CUK0_9CNID|nr:C-type lectin domain 19 member A [Desmophyllum pertusum]